MIIPYGGTVGAFLPDLPDFEFAAEEDVRVKIDLFAYPESGAVSRTVYDEVLTPVGGVVTVVDTPSLVAPCMEYGAGAEHLFTRGVLLQIGLGAEAMYALAGVKYASASVCPPSLYVQGGAEPAADSYEEFVSGMLLSQCRERRVLPDGMAHVYYVPSANDMTFTVDALLGGRALTAALTAHVPMDGTVCSLDVSPTAVLSALREQNALPSLFTVDALAAYCVTCAGRANPVTFRVLHDTAGVTARFLYRGLFGLMEELPVEGVTVRTTDYPKETPSSGRRLLPLPRPASVTHEVSTALVPAAEAEAYRSLFRSPAVWLRSADPRLDMQEVVIHDITCEESDAPDSLLSYKFKYRLCLTAEKALDL